MRFRTKKTTQAEVPAEVPACGICGSTALHHVAYGMPSMAMRDEAGRRPDLRLGGCVIGSDRSALATTKNDQRKGSV